ncbi:MAG: ATP-binding protein [Thermodesulfobacteriota bacterium]|nr:ATP-binding protein [Thermodesulfobacteriota bacterium]
MNKGIFDRQISKNSSSFFSQKEIHIITGVRRSGKSTLMRLLMQHLIKDQDISPHQILYLNFEDERFVNFSVEDFQTLHETYLSLEGPAGKQYFFLDEIQNIEHWQRWVNRIYEFSDTKIFVTGSNAAMLSSEIASTLTGRNRVIEVFPLSFLEFIEARGWSPEKKDFFKPEVRAALANLFDRYLKTGGFPEALKTGDLSILQEYFRDIIYRDIVARHGLKNVRELKELALYLATNHGSRTSLKKMKDIVSVRSLSTVKNYINYLEDTYLFFSIDLFSYSLKKQIYNPSKIYCVDHALAAAVGFKFSADAGRILENIVCVELKRRGHEIFYWRNQAGIEVDFLIKQGRDITAIIQVCLSLDDKLTRQRETRGALAAAQEFNLKEATIITSDTWQQEIIDGVKIDMIPAWKWLLENQEVHHVSTSF